MRRFNSTRWIGAGVAAVGLVMMGYGVWRGEMAVVFIKAVNICLECVGIG